MAKKLSIQEQIKKALDGRSQRWLAMEIKMPESNLSKKMQGKDNYIFTTSDIAKINKRLNVKIAF
jgi:hypothetical protein